VVDLFVVMVSLVVIIMDAYYVGPPLIWLTALRALRWVLLDWVGVLGIPKPLTAALT